MVKTGDTPFRESGASSGKRQKRFWMNTVFHGTGRVLAAFGLLLFSLLCASGVVWAQTVSIADSEGNPDTGVVFTVTLSGTVGAAKARVDYRTVEKTGCDCNTREIRGVLPVSTIRTPQAGLAFLRGAAAVRRRRLPYGYAATALFPTLGTGSMFSWRMRCVFPSAEV